MLRMCDPHRFQSPSDPTLPCSRSLSGLGIPRREAWLVCPLRAAGPGPPQGGSMTGRMETGTFSARGAAVCCWPQERDYSSNTTLGNPGCFLKTYETRNPPEDGDGGCCGQCQRLATTSVCPRLPFPCGSDSVPGLRGDRVLPPSLPLMGLPASLGLLSTPLLPEGLSWPQAALPLKGAFLWPYLRNPKPAWRQESRP